MGLDISAVSKIKQVEGEEGTHYVAADKFERHTLQQSWYTSSYDSRVYWFRAGAYSSYNAFRRDLCGFAHGVNDTDIWNNLEKYKGGKFHEIIEFSDCQGAIGAEVSGKLHADFVDGRDAFVKWVTEKYRDDLEVSKYRVKVYDDFTLAFEIAKDDGMVVFC